MQLRLSCLKGQPSLFHFLFFLELCQFGILYINNVLFGLDKKKSIFGMDVFGSIDIIFLTKCIEST